MDAFARSDLECSHPTGGGSDSRPLTSGRYAGRTAQIHMDLRLGGPAGGIASADLFRVDSSDQRTWVASLRSTTPVSGQVEIVAQDRYGATATGWLRLVPVTTGALQVLFYFDGKLDGLPLRRETALTAEFVGTALRRFGLEVEVEQDVLGPPQTTFNDTAMSIETALSGAGIEITAAGVGNEIPPAPEEGWSEKDIEALSREFAQIDMANPGFALQMLWLSRSNRPGLLGVMFDTGDDRPRQSLAVFASEIRDRFPNGGADRDRKLIQTAVHEIGHALNLAHRFEREVGRADSTSFMNYDWRYRGGNRAPEFWEKFAYRFDPDELSFLCHAPYMAIAAGGAHFHSVRYWHEGDGGYSPYVPEHPLPGIRIGLAAAPGGFYRFAEPVLLSISLENRTGRPLRVPDSILDPKSGFVEILVRRVARGRHADTPPESFHPVVTRCFEIGEDQLTTIPNGGRIEDNINLTFGASGFTFAEPGVYEVQALLVLYDGQLEIERIASSPSLQISVGYPEARNDYALADEIFQPDVGRWFALGAPARLESVTDRLVDMTRGKGRVPDEIAAHILRTGMFGANRSSLRVADGKLVRTEADGKRSAQLARRLAQLGLNRFDPVTGQQTKRYMDDNFAPAKAAGGEPLPA